MGIGIQTAIEILEGENVLNDEREELLHLVGHVEAPQGLPVPLLLGDLNVLGVHLGGLMGLHVEFLRPLEG